MSEFQLTRSGSERLWVGTPFPVPLNVWSSFVFQIFPQLQSPDKSYNPTKYLNRWENGPVDEIAEGQVGRYFTHAYLPHCERSDRRIHDWGLVHVPDNRTYYLDQIAGDLEDNPKSRAALLGRLNQNHKDILLQLFQRLTGECRKDPKTTEGLRKSLIINLSCDNVLDGNMAKYEKWRCNSDYKIGELPVFMNGPTNVLSAQTSLDFLRDLDVVLGSDRELTGSERYCGLVEYRMHELYDHLLPQEQRWVWAPFKIQITAT